jgi:S-adenosylmethionine synthetase
MKVDVDVLAFPAPDALSLEIVERKGIGHPDTICDALAETFSSGLSRFYLDRFGSVLHHNVDKALLCGGAARPAFGGGELLAPIEIHLAGRATCEVEGVVIPVAEIAVEGSRCWLREHLSHLDPRDVRIVAHVRPTSPELSAMFRRAHESRTPLANDTSFGVGFAPLDELERVVLVVERTLNAPQTKRAHPAIGEDVKVMGARRGGEIALTVACAIVGRHVANLAAYLQTKADVRELAIEAARTVTAAPLEVAVNASDSESPQGIYLTVTGLSAESGDDGQVGRGNRVNGLITPYRPMSLEAAAGKNPVAHVGKLYNIMAMRIAQRVVAELPAVKECYCYLLSRIGHPINDPQICEVKVRPVEEKITASLARNIDELARAEFATVNAIWREAVEGPLILW